ncbi:MAG: endo-1,4-beta-xylanase [Bacteroidales bacterium]|nr:endo-1,4-beta-xylanase [Bacteroidales bacterium]
MNLGSTSYRDTIPSIQESYQGYYLIGTAISTRSLGNETACKIAGHQFNSITPENSMKWEKIHPSPGEYNFGPSDRFVEFGEKNRMHLVGHVLIWHQQTPEWVFLDESGNQVTREELLRRMEEHITTVVSRYKGRIHSWDVVNEAIDDDGSFRQNNWAKIIGEDYVQKAFEFAREADSNAILIYNDYSLPTPEKRDGVLKLIKGLQEKGIRVDAIGMQGHYHLDYPDLDDLEASIVAFAELGCKVHFTEMDINVLPLPVENTGADIALNFAYDEYLNPWPDGLPDSVETALAERYAAFFKLFNKHKDKIDRVTLWGIQDGSSWLNYWPVQGRSNYPLLFDRDYKPKKAFYSVLELVKR